MTSNRFPPYYDLCLRCREKGLDQVAEFIHELVETLVDAVNERERLREALQHMVRWHDQLSPADIAKAEAALKEGE